MQTIFDACVSQCEWCAARWPTAIYPANVVHVAPFTKDPKLFNAPCAAAAVRRGFDYWEYAGGPKVEFKPRPLAVVARKTFHRGPKQIAFWRNLCATVIEVSYWPAWKQGADYKRSHMEVSVARATERQHIYNLDEIEFYMGDNCCGNVTYSPALIGGNHVKPTCNLGIGCNVCWKLYQDCVDDWERRNPCAY